MGCRRPTAWQGEHRAGISKDGHKKGVAVWLDRRVTPLSPGALSDASDGLPGPVGCSHLEVCAIDDWGGTDAV